VAIISGRGGALRLGGREAAVLTDWAVDNDLDHRGGFIVRCALTEINPIFINAPAAVEVRLQMVKRIWRWRACRLAVDGDRATVWATGEPDVM
jgi:hypothetical protein